MRPKAIRAIFLKEWKIETRNPHIIGGVLLYIVSSVFVSWLSLKQISNLALWNALFWIITLFGVFNSSHRVFAQESGHQMYYLLQVAHPREILFGKLLFTVILNSLVCVLTFLCFNWFFGAPTAYSDQVFMLLGVFVLGVMGLSAILTLMAGITFQSGNNPGLVAVLGLPVVLPILLVSIKLSKLILDGVAFVAWADYLGALFGLVVAVFALASLLFPYLWRE